MNEQELRILGDHYSKGRRILLDEHLEIEDILKDKSLFPNDKIIIIVGILNETMKRLNAQQKVYTMAMYGQSE